MFIILCILPFKCVKTFCPEKVHVVFEDQLEDVVLVDLVYHGVRFVHSISKQGEASQREVILKSMGAYRTHFLQHE